MVRHMAEIPSGRRKTPGCSSPYCPRKEVIMNPLNKMIRRLHPGTYVTPISVMWSVRQAVMGDHVPLENPPFKTDKP